MKSKQIILIFIFIVSVNHRLHSQGCNVTVYTPTSVPVCAYYEQLAPDAIIKSYEDQARSWFIDHPDKIATRIGPASNQYNCHAYAWHISEGGDIVNIFNIHLDSRALAHNVEKYFSGSSPSYEVCNSDDAEKVFFGFEADHSAIPASKSGTFISKWGKWGLYEHFYMNCPYDYSNITYYKACGTIFEGKTFNSDYSLSTCKVELKDVKIQNSSDVSFTITIGAHIEGPFKVDIGSTFNLTP